MARPCRRLLSLLGSLLALAAGGALGALPGGTASATPPPYDWVKLSPATSPSARDSMASAYDAATKQLILYGGETAGGTVLGDTWSWTGSTWTQLSPKTSPPALRNAAMAYDATTKQLLLFGGINSFGVVETDTWSWTGSTWEQLKPSASPPGGSAPSLAWDAGTSQLVLFGGAEEGSQVSSETWLWSGSTWQRLKPATSPPGLYGACVAYYPNTKLLLLFGGLTSGTSASASSEETWAWTGTTWAEEEPATVPAARFGAAMAYDAASYQMIMIGGGAVVGSSLVSYGATWTWASGDWHEQAPATRPPHRAVATMTFDGATNQELLFGGSPVPGTDYNDTWVWERQP